MVSGVIHLYAQEHLFFVVGARDMFSLVSTSCAGKLAIPYNYSFIIQSLSKIQIPTTPSPSNHLKTKTPRFAAGLVMLKEGKQNSLERSSLLLFFFIIQNRAQKGKPIIKRKGYKDDEDCC
ncbi:hypothetical protein ACJX0J_035191 [Zea mays]